jgi:hypothetical protein
VPEKSGSERGSLAAPGLALRVRRPPRFQSHIPPGASSNGGWCDTVGAALPRICGFGHVVRAAATSNSDVCGDVGAV